MLCSVVLVFIVGLATFSHGYTPTFRNEATHPLKPPTESTLGLQLNEESTNGDSSASKSDTYLAGGKHFEYLLLNDSNVLLTSLQNDFPIDLSPDKNYHRMSNFNASRTDSIVPVPLYTNSTKSSVSTEFSLMVNKTILPTRRMPDITSTTKLYSKQANKTDEDFATFTSPLTSSGLIRKKEGESLSAVQNFDYDDSFTKLLISNGILKPDNRMAFVTRKSATNLNRAYDPETTTTDKVEAIFESAAHLSTQMANNSNTNGELTLPTTNGFVPFATNESSEDVRFHSTTTRRPLKLYKSDKRKVLKHSQPFGIALQSDVSSMSHYSFSNQPAEYIATKRALVEDESLSDNDLSNENPLGDVRSYTARSIRSSSNPDPINLHGDAEQSAKLFVETSVSVGSSERSLVGDHPPHSNDELYFAASGGPHNIEKKSFGGSSKATIFVDEFKTLVERAVRCFFGSAARFLVSFASVKTHERKVTLRRLIVATPSPKIVERYVFNWTYLGAGNRRQIDVDPRLAQLFSDESNVDVRWLVQLSSDSGAARDFGNGETLETVVPFGLDLVYAGHRVDGVLLVPRTLLANYSRPSATTTANRSLIGAKEELIFDDNDAANVTLELGGHRYRAFQATATGNDGRLQQPSPETRFVDTKHDDIELYVFVFLGAICTFGVLSPLLYGVYRFVQNRTGGVSSALSSSSSSGSSFKWPSIFGDKFQYEGHAKMPESRCESLNVIFSEEFDRRYSSWFDNTQHSSSILKASGDETHDSTLFNDRLDDFPEFSDLTRNVCENSPRLSKENRLNMGCRQSCVLLPNPATYLKRSGAAENENRCFDNPNYDCDAR